MSKRLNKEKKKVLFFCDICGEITHTAEFHTIGYIYESRCHHCGNHVRYEDIEQFHLDRFKQENSKKKKLKL